MASVNEIEQAWKRQEAKIIEAGADPLAAATMVNGLKTAHLGFAWAVQSAADPSKVQVKTTTNQQAKKARRG